jgi:tetratricopeptide (TPR) repeat protein
VTSRLFAIGVCCAAWATSGSTSSASAQTGGLTGAPQIARVYDAILDARFEQVPDLLQQTCAPGSARPPAAPVRPHIAVCQLLDLVALWWQIQLDPFNTSRDAAFANKANTVIGAMEAWTRVEPMRAEAWFYLGGAYGARGQWRVLRGQLLSAARDGKRIKDALERSLALDPNLLDAYFGIGLYHYYADVAPAAAKMLRFLLFLPGGDKKQGMTEMLQARNGGQLLRSEADYQLHVLYLWYEHQPRRARELVASLRDRYPRNPHFLQVIAEINDTYLHDDMASLRAWQSMLAAAQDGRLAFPPMAEARARLGIAQQLERLYESDAALEQVRAVIQAAPTAPFGATAQAALLRGQALDRLGSRAEAVDAYRQAIAAAGPGDPLKVAARARAGMRTAPNADAALAYRLSIEGWRALERGALPEANRLLGESLALRPNEPVTKYRLARVRLSQNNAAAALPLLEQIVTPRGATMPATLYAYACIDAADIFEQMGARARAIELFARAAGVFGADERTTDAARLALARLSPPRLTPGP